MFIQVSKFLVVQLLCILLREKIVFRVKFIPPEPCHFLTLKNRRDVSKMLKSVED